MSAIKLNSSIPLTLTDVAMGDALWNCERILEYVVVVMVWIWFGFGFGLDLDLVDLDY
jgi:hypothetical protein